MPCASCLPSFSSLFPPLSFSLSTSYPNYSHNSQWFGAANRKPRRPQKQKQTTPRFLRGKTCPGNCNTLSTVKMTSTMTSTPPSTCDTSIPQSISITSQPLHNPRREMHKNNNNASSAKTASHPAQPGLLHTFIHTPPYDISLPAQSTNPSTSFYDSHPNLYPNYSYTIHLNQSKLTCQPQPPAPSTQQTPHTDTPPTQTESEQSSSQPTAT